jgi:hypothetical protein
MPCAKTRRRPQRCSLKMRLLYTLRRSAKCRSRKLMLRKLSEREGVGTEDRSATVPPNQSCKTCSSILSATEWTLSDVLETVKYLSEESSSQSKCSAIAGCHSCLHPQLPRIPRHLTMFSSRSEEVFTKKTFCTTTTNLQTAGCSRMLAS